MEDKSSREGLQETQSLKLFKNLLIGLINKFEIDRSSIAHELSQFDLERNADKRKLEEAEELAESLRRRSAEKNNENKTDEAKADSIEETIEIEKAEALAHLLQHKDERIEKLEYEQKLLRGLASSGIVTAAFSHDVTKTRTKLLSRAEKIKELLKNKVTENDYLDVERRKNPFTELDRLKKHDKKIYTWLGFTLGFTRKDKRFRRDINLKSYFLNIKEEWVDIFIERSITLEVNCDEKYILHAHEIDLDSIFLNLFINSIDAIEHATKNQQMRKIFINIKEENAELTLEYKDTGDGLSPDIDPPETIFEPLYTTKRDSEGTSTGTGLGMWIVHTIIEEYKGKINIVMQKESHVGFFLNITFPEFKVKELTQENI